MKTLRENAEALLLSGEIDKTEYCVCAAFRQKRNTSRHKTDGQSMMRSARFYFEHFDRKSKCNFIIFYSILFYSNKIQEDFIIWQENITTPRPNKMV